MKVSFVIPAFNAAQTISDNIESIISDNGLNELKLEIIVVNDGSEDSDDLKKTLNNHKGIKLINHQKNLGMCAARNSGISNSCGDYVIILDADDVLVPNWSIAFKAVVDSCPEEVGVLYASCKNQLGAVTASRPDYQGYLTLDDLLNERYSGEYLPIFKGDYLRAKLYKDLGTKKSCGIVSYINFALDGPFWISKTVLRIYNEDNPSSVSRKWTTKDKAAETVVCYRMLLDQYGYLYRKIAPKIYHSKMLRFSVYLRWANETNYWKYFLYGISIKTWKESIGTMFLLLIGRKAAGNVAQIAKKYGIIRKYG